MLGNSGSLDLQFGHCGAGILPAKMDVQAGSPHHNDMSELIQFYKDEPNSSGYT